MPILVYLLVQFIMQGDLVIIYLSACNVILFVFTVILMIK